MGESIADKIVQIQLAQGHLSGFVLVALTETGRIFAKMDGITASGDWIEVERPPTPNEVTQP